jgi:hypothetical protein
MDVVIKKMKPPRTEPVIYPAVSRFTSSDKYNIYVKIFWLYAYYVVSIYCCILSHIIDIVFVYVSLYFNKDAFSVTSPIQH